MGQRGNPNWIHGQTRKVPPGLHAEIIRKTQDGMDSNAVAAWLKEAHGIETCAANVRRIVIRHRSEQADQAKSVVRAELRTHLIPAIERIDRVGRKAEALCRRWLTLSAELREKNPHDPLAMTYDARALKAMDRTMKSAVALLHYAGLDQPDDLNKLAVPAAERRAALLKRLEELARPQLPPATNGTQAN